MSLDPSKNSAIESLREELSRKLDSQNRQIAITRRMVLIVLILSVGLVALAVLNTVLELARAPRTETREARSSVPRDREVHLQLAFIGILVAVFGILMLAMPGF